MNTKNINIDWVQSNNWEVPVTIDVRKWYRKYIVKWLLFVLVWSLFWICAYSYSISQSKEDKALLDFKEAIHNNDTANKNSLDIIKREQNLINDRTKLNDKYKKEIEKIVNKYNPLSWIIPKASANDTENINDILDSKIKRFCNEHKLSKEVYFEDSMWDRCRLMLQGIYRFETWNLRSYVWNNIFNFRSPAIKKEWREKYWVSKIKNWFLVFPDRTNSIKFAVDRFYRIDRYKTIRMIIAWWCYISPVDSKKKCFPWYTFTEEHKDNYISYLKNYYKNNL